MADVIMSTLPKTWILDLDGTLLKHNGYLIDGEDSMLDGAKRFIDSIPTEDRIVILTSRSIELKESTIEFLIKNSIRHDEILFDIPMGERIIVNDRKPSGIDMAYAINIDRNELRIPNIIRKL